MDEQAADGGRQGLTADGARLIEVDSRKGAHAADRVVDSVAKFRKQLSVCCAGVQFCFEGGQLRWAERFAFGISEQAVEAAHDVAQMKGDGSNAGGTSVEGLVAERCAPLLDVFAAELECVDDGAQDGRSLGVSSAEPGFH